MTSSHVFQMLIGAGVVWAAVGLLVLIFRGLVVAVEDEHVALVTRFGKLTATLSRPGAHLLFDKAMPWVTVKHVSLARDFREVKNLHVNDAGGTTVLADLWIELRIVNPEKALFAVEDWDKATLNLISHAATAALSRRQFSEILRDNSALATTLQKELSQETERWGVKVEQVFLRDVSLLPEVSRQLFAAVAARLDRARVVIEELGRIDVARLESTTALQVAHMVAEAKAQYPLAVGEALAHMKSTPPVLRAYNELYGLNLMRPHRMISFRGFSPDEMRSTDVAMLPDAAATQSGS
jgi:regulator of protease activity HflC (stomatin/prohibitin superfamily)